MRAVARAGWRCVRFLLVLLVGCVLAALAVGLAVWVPRQWRRWRPVWCRYWFGAVLWSLDVRLLVLPEDPDLPVGALLVANHISWLDVVGIGALTGCRFVAKTEVAAWPLIGWLAGRGATLFVARGERGSAARVAEQLGFLLRAGEQVAVFPEGTTTDGSGLRPFKPRLLVPALHAGRPILPLALSYTVSAGQGVPVAAFLGETSFVPHLLTVMSAPAMNLRIAVGAPLFAAAGESRQCLAARAAAAVRESGWGADSAARVCNRTVTTGT